MQKFLHEIVRRFPQMKRFVVVAVLALALSGVTVAGEMPVGGIVPPSPPEQTSITGTVVLALISLLPR
jgi:hypothetical protein